MKLVAHWRLWWRRWSTWLAGAFATVTGLVVANPGLLLGLINYVPDHARGFIAGAVAVLVFLVPVLVAHLRQPKLKDKVDATRN
jgi:hypothetical protein